MKMNESVFKMFRRKPAEAAAGGDAAAVYLLVGLGNPGREYRETRHNVGFMVIDQLCKDFNLSLTRVQSKALVGSVMLDDRRVILAKPQTYMNLSGQAISALMHFYKIPVEQLLVAHDDIDLPLGTLRLRPGGGSAGQKGIASTIEQLGNPNFARMRLGIGRPGGQKAAADYVLQDFNKADREILDLVLPRAAEAARVFVRSGLETAMNQFNGALEKG